jgi:N-acetylmuramic acid 6-phosphate etherase
VTEKVGWVSPTEARNPKTMSIDMLPTMDILKVINAEDATVASCVATVLPDLARLVDLATTSLSGGGRVHYSGAGTSGRIAVLDAVELPQTFGIPSDWFIAHHAGGPEALGKLVEDVEDEEDIGADDVREVTSSDLVVGLSASGRSPYVVGALRQAKRNGASAALVSANPGAAVAAEVDLHIAVPTGPEAITGSTRMKAATAQKLILNALSTTVMVRLGYTYSNLMVGVVATNDKLRGRSLAILSEATGLPADQSARSLEAAGGDVRVALVSLLADIPVAAARAALTAAGGSVRAALRG